MSIDRIWAKPVPWKRHGDLPWPIHYHLHQGQITFFDRVAILFAGGPAPAANAVISAAAASFLRAGVQVVGIKHGYSKLAEYAKDNPLIEGQDYIHLTHKGPGKKP